MRQERPRGGMTLGVFNKVSLVNGGILSRKMTRSGLQPLRYILSPCLSISLTFPPFETPSTHWADIKIRITGTSLVAQWLRICLPMKGTQVRALVREDPTCCRTTEPAL